MKRIMLLVLALCLCFTAISAALAETTEAEASAEKPAADLGVPSALFGLGECFYEGNGAEKDPDKAAEW